MTGIPSIIGFTFQIEWFDFCLQRELLLQSSKKDNGNNDSVQALPMDSYLDKTVIFFFCFEAFAI